MFDALFGVLCCGGALVLLVVLGGAIAYVAALRRRGAVEVDLDALAGALALERGAGATWVGTRGGRRVALRLVRARPMSYSGGSPGGGGPRVLVGVACDHPELGGDCYPRRPWRAGTSFAGGYACLPEVDARLDDAVRAGLVALVEREDGRAELLDRGRSAFVRDALGGAPVGVVVDVAPDGLDPARAWAIVDALAAVAAALEARGGAGGAADG